jgi:hypothetical protein
MNISSTSLTKEAVVVAAGTVLEGCSVDISCKARNISTEGIRDFPQSSELSSGIILR